MKSYYSNEKNVQILISLLKAHNIKKIIVSPGATNVSFVGSVQIDPFFQLYSVVDERAAAYIACGLSEESKEPVVISCTGATASRNYLPGLTEAFYKHLPILAITSTLHFGRVGHYIPQVIDRTVQSMDMVKKSVQIPIITNNQDEETAIVSINDAILELVHGNHGPVHINLATSYSYDFSVKTLKNYRVIKRITKNDKFPELNEEKIGIFVGNHLPFSKQETIAIDSFCKKHNAIVICDHTSNYNGKYKIMGNLIQARTNLLNDCSMFIHIGYVSGAGIGLSKKVWRVNRDGIIRDLNRKLEYVFEMDEIDFFNHYSLGIDKNDSFYLKCKSEYDKIVNSIKEIPFSNIWIAKNTIGHLEPNSELHLSILNSLRSWNFFEKDDSISCFSNTGGFGIDGCLSSLIGAATCRPEKQFYGVIGDLAFFYDVNSLTKGLPNNIHLMVINNGVGIEFKNYNHRSAIFGKYADKYMAAKGHNGFKSTTLIKNLAQCLGIEYYSASSKEEYISIKDKWEKANGKAMIVEAFTDEQNESDALKIINGPEPRKSPRDKLARFVKNTKIGRIIRRVLGR